MSYASGDAATNHGIMVLKLNNNLWPRESKIQVFWAFSEIVSKKKSPMKMRKNQKMKNQKIKNRNISIINQ